MSLLTKCGLSHVFNAILVQENIRPAMLIQPQDYGEATGKDPITKQIVAAIQTQFPDLLQTEAYETYQGVILSKTTYHGQAISLQRMGEILGYPCFDEFDHMDRNRKSEAIHVVAKETNGRRTQLFANVCQSAKPYLQSFQPFVEIATVALKQAKYKPLLQNVVLDKVEVQVHTLIPTQHLIDGLVSGRMSHGKWKQEEMDKIQNLLFNLGFSVETQLAFAAHFQPTNPRHQGILLDMLIKEKHDTLSPFYPLQSFPEQETKVKVLTAALEQAFVDILQKTKSGGSVVGKRKRAVENIYSSDAAPPVKKRKT